MPLQARGVSRVAVTAGNAMTDYYPLIARAVAGLEKNTGDQRRALYERARTALVAQLRGLDPPLTESEITRERLALEESIRKVEAEAARKARFETPRIDPVTVTRPVEAPKREQKPLSSLFTQPPPAPAREPPARATARGRCAMPRGSCAGRGRAPAIPRRRRVPTTPRRRRASRPWPSDS